MAISHSLFREEELFIMENINLALFGFLIPLKRLFPLPFLSHFEEFREGFEKFETKRSRNNFEIIFR